MALLHIVIVSSEGMPVAFDRMNKLTHLQTHVFHARDMSQLDALTKAS